jgi:hypothetical protein
MAFHNILLMFLLNLQTPVLLIRVVQAWKEGILVLLGMIALLRLFRLLRKGERFRLSILDWVVVAFTALTLVYLVLPASLMHTSANLHQRLLGARLVLLLPALYLFGRIFPPERRSEIRWAAGLILGSAGIVGLFGAWELWFLPTQAWLGWGVNQLSAFLGFAYNGPKSLPANFFQTTAEGYLLRRMVSTYVSPLGIAYAGILVVPLAVALLLERRGSGGWRTFLWLAMAFLIVGIIFSLTRLALLVVVLEFLLLAILSRRRWVLYTTPVVALMVVFALFGYVRVGPLMDRNLQAITDRPSSLHIATGSDPSLNEHSGLLGYDVLYVIHHPMGTGLGSSVHRFGTSEGTGESAVLDMFGDLGVVGGLLYLLMYAGMLLMGAFAYWRHRADPLLAALPLVALVGGLALGPITLTSDVYGDFATTFLIWWAAGASATLYLINLPGLAADSEPDPGRSLWLPRNNALRRT